MSALTDDILIKVVSEIHDPVTTTDELIPSGETSSFRSNPLGLAEFALSRKDPEYVGTCKRSSARQRKQELPARDIVAALPEAERCICIRSMRNSILILHKTQSRKHDICSEAG